MADDRHLSVLRAGPSAWLAWRTAHPEILPDLSGADLHLSTLYNTNLANAQIVDVDLTSANLVQCNLRGALLQRCKIYGISVWQVDLQGATQTDLVITPAEESTITVDAEADLLASLRKMVIMPLEAMVRDLRETPR